MAIETSLTQERIHYYTSKGYWTGVNLNQFVDRSIARSPDKTAIVDSKTRITYGELGRLRDRIALGFLELGIKRGDVVTVQLPNWAEFVLIHLALERIGAITNPVLPNYRHKEMRYILGKAESVAAVIPYKFRNFDHTEMIKELRPELTDLKHVFVVGDTAPAGTQAFQQFTETPWEDKVSPSVLREFQPDGNEVTLLLFTSGTEADPKGAMHTHNTLMYGTLALAKELGMTSDDVVFEPSPIVHATGIEWGVRQALTQGSKLVLQDIWDPEEALRLVGAEACTYTIGATPFAHQMVTSPKLPKYDLRTFRYFLSGGAPIPRALVGEVKAKMGCQLLSVYGMTEHFISTACRPEDPQEKISSTDGRPMPGVEIRIYDDNRRELPIGQEGELACRGPNVFVGYFKDPERTKATFNKEGFQFSGDTCVMDTDGFIRVVGRKKDIIIRGGMNISPAEVENLLYTHPKIQDIAIVAMPDERMGEKACAYVVPKPGETLSFDEMVAFLKEKKLATYKLPERLEVVQELPMTASGKVQKYLLRDDIARKLGLRPLIK